MSAVNRRLAVLVLTTVMAGAACGVEPVTVPTPTGPSELGLSLELAATPDVISQDGVSTSQLGIRALGATGQPLSGVPLRVDVMVPTPGGLVVADYGTLSDRWPTTGADGRATVVYRAPPQPAPSATSDTVITLSVTPIGANFANAIPRVATVKLVRPGIIRPPTRMDPDFMFSPTSPREYDDIFFDASSSSDPDSHIVLYRWEFGDGRTGTGRQTVYAYELAGTYNATLIVSDAYGASKSKVKTVSVTGSAAPVARFTISPTTPRIGTTVVFNAAGSTASAGRRVVGYNWDLGDGTFVEGPAPTHVYTTPGTYSVVLVVTDDAGRKGVATSTITVDDLDAPVANFTVSPTDPVPGTTIVFNAAGSTVAFGRTILSYEWSFGHVVDGVTQTGTGAVVAHAFPSEGTYTVVLTVTDSAGRKGVKSLTLTVKTPTDAAPILESNWELRR